MNSHLAQEVRKPYPDIRVLLMTGYSDVAVPTEDHLPILRKPFELSGLERAVRETLAMQDRQEPGATRADQPSSAIAMPLGGGGQSAQHPVDQGGRTTEDKKIFVFNILWEAGRQLSLLGSRAPIEPAATGRAAGAQGRRRRFYVISHSNQDFCPCDRVSACI